MSTITEWPGRQVKTRDELDAVLELGAWHLATCDRCKRPFFRSKPDTERCYMCWYESFLDDAESNYIDVFDALRGAGFSPEMTQTGGMCLAIWIPYGRTHHFLLTDAEDVLSFDRELDQGWGLGVYSNGEDESDDGAPLAIHEGGEDLLTAPIKSADFAIGIVRTATANLRKHLGQDK